MDYILGIDQGATKTLVALADLQGNILSWGNAPGSYHSIYGVEHALRQMRIAAKQAIQKVDAKKERIVAVGAGITGVDFQGENTLLQNALEEEFAVPSIVVNDCMIALQAESMKPGSMIICGGTGLNIGILAHDGREYTFGYYIDNRWQGGVSIGERTLQMITEISLGMRQQSKLTGKVLEYFGKQTVDDLLEQIYTRDGKKYLKYLVPIVQEVAAEGDKIAVNILKYFSDGCSRYALAGLHKYNMMHRPVTIYLSGGIFKNTESLLNDMLTTTLQRKHPQVTVINAEFEPVVGGVKAALEKVYGGKVPLEIVKQVHESAYAVGLERNKK